MSGRASRHVHAHAVDQGSRALPLLFSNRRLCLACGRRRPRFRHRGIVKTDADHTLCFQCYRAQMQRTRAALMAAAYARGGDRIERHIPMIPLSKDVARAESLRRSLAVYRMAFGQSRQDDLVAYLQRHMTSAQIDEAMKELPITLLPPEAPHRSRSGRNQDPGDLPVSLEPEADSSPEFGLSALEDLLDAFTALRAQRPGRSAADLDRLLNDFVALAALDPAWRQKWQSGTQMLI